MSRKVLPEPSEVPDCSIDVPNFFKKYGVHLLQEGVVNMTATEFFRARWLLCKGYGCAPLLQLLILMLMLMKMLQLLVPLQLPLPILLMLVLPLLLLLLFLLLLLLLLLLQQQ